MLFCRGGVRSYGDIIVYKHKAFFRWGGRGWGCIKIATRTTFHYTTEKWIYPIVLASIISFLVV